MEAQTGSQGLSHFKSKRIPTVGASGIGRREGTAGCCLGEADGVRTHLVIPVAVRVDKLAEGLRKSQGQEDLRCCLRFA